MRLLVWLALAAGSVRGQGAREGPRAWKGEISVRAASRAPADGRGGEQQQEQLEFLLMAAPPRQAGSPVRFRMREGTGRYSLRIDRVEGRVTTKGSAAGRLYPRVAGSIDRSTGRYRLRVSATPARIVAKAMLSGIDRGRFRTFAMPISRRPFTASFAVEGQLTRGGRVIEGRRQFLDRTAEHARQVTITWRIERIDPVLQGRVIDHLGRPVAGVRIVATSSAWDAIRKRRVTTAVRKGQTGPSGRFRIEAFWSSWRIRPLALERAGLLYAPRSPRRVALAFDRPVEEEFVVDAYRLRALRDARLLRGRFRGDPGAYLRYAWPRMDEKQRRLALVAPPGER